MSAALSYESLEDMPEGMRRLVEKQLAKKAEQGFGAAGNPSVCPSGSQLPPRGRLLPPPLGEVARRAGGGPRLHPVKMLRFDCCNTGTDKVKYMVIETNTQISGVLPAFRARRGRSASKES